MTYQVTPFITLNGNAREAIRFYESALEAKVVFMQTYGEGPEDQSHPLPTHSKERIAHSVLKIGGAELFVADSISDEPNEIGHRLQICITTPDTETSARFFEALLDGGQVVMPLQETYFSPAFGIVTDRYGITIQLFTPRDEAKEGAGVSTK
ncbi:VOC family protein [Paenibacillus sp. LHD-117]|uniref:VOC family protein n=1 Tax=Paenibacillus sp. LHD-117 TaxID=3071412 RepID=UPI0027DFEE8E|nr:VOC family protein [Paenibacillus sp. LHD-117]MDQ6421417.1 VOC family protein [Paenibacillus sp. LHD-117]